MNAVHSSDAGVVVVVVVVGLTRARPEPDRGPTGARPGPDWGPTGALPRQRTMDGARAALVLGCGERSVLLHLQPPEVPLTVCLFQHGSASACLLLNI